MKFTRRWIPLAFLPLVAATLPVAARGRAADTDAPKPTIQLVADLSSKRLKLYEADTLVAQYEISDGTGGYPTPTGDFSIRHLVWNPSWTPPPGAKWAKKYTPKDPGDPMNPMKVVKIFFKEPDYYIHGTGETGRLGEAASHGCIRMDPEYVGEVARFVMEHGGQARPENWFWRVLHFRREEKPIYLKNPVPLRIQR